MFGMDLRVALIGAGNVTRAFLKYWSEHAFDIDLRIVSVVRKRGVWHGDEIVNRSRSPLDLESLAYTPDLDPFNDARLAIEALPSVYPHGEPATSLIRSALRREIDVLTVDKGPLVAAYKEFMQISKTTGARLKFCVGGALPAVDVALRDLRGTELRSIRAILNGTTNFILSEMQARGCTLEDALSVAIERGIAEPDPSQDLNGTDTAAKMVILVNAALGLNIRLDDVEIRGISGLDGSKGIWKLIGTYTDGAIRVQPELVPESDLFSRIGGTDKIVEFDSVEMGKLAVAGGASGRTQMGAAMTKEILNLYLDGKMGTQKV
jgi:homoserine dehydrogenase